MPAAGERWGGSGSAARACTASTYGHDKRRNTKTLDGNGRAAGSTDMGTAGVGVGTATTGGAGGKKKKRKDKKRKQGGKHPSRGKRL